MERIYSDEDLTSFLAAVFDDEPQPAQAMPESLQQPGDGQQASGAMYASDVWNTSVARVSENAGSGILEESKTGRKRIASSSSSGNKHKNKGDTYLHRQLSLQKLQRHLTEQQHELRLQRQRKLYLTERVTMLEQLIQIHMMSEECQKNIAAGLTYNPFIAFNSTVEEFTKAKPGWIVQKFQYVTQCLGHRLASITPLFQKYPQLETYRIPMNVLDEIVQELSLAEPTNPHGAAGLPIGSLTIPVPAAILAKFAAAYNLDLSSMTGMDRAMLATCVTLVVEQACLSQSYKHAYFMLPDLHLGNAVHMSAAASNASWEDLTSALSSIQLHEAGDKNSKSTTADATVADEAHWRNVAANLEMTCKQKLQAAILWENITKAKQRILSHRAQLVRQLPQLPRPASVPDVGSSTATASYHITQPQPLLQLSSQAVLQRGLSEDNSSNAAACYRLGSEQLTQQEALMRRLDDTLSKERYLMVLAAAGLFGCILCKVQLAKALVHSHPFIPAHVAILSACAAEFTPAVMDALVTEEL